MDIEKRLKENLKYSQELCELLNKDCKGNIKFSAIASNDSIGVKQLLDDTGLHYNEIFYNDKIKDNCSLKEIVVTVYVSLGTGIFRYIYPTEKEMKLYKTLKENNWDIYLDKGELYIDEGLAVEDIEDYEITKEYVKLKVIDAEFYGYKEMIVKELDGELDIEYVE